MDTISFFNGAPGLPGGAVITGGGHDIIAAAEQEADLERLDEGEPATQGCGLAHVQAALLQNHLFLNMEELTKALA